MSVQTSSLRRLQLAKFHLGLALQHAKTGREWNYFAAINHLQDGVEAFLAAASGHLNASIGPKTDFVAYLDAIDAKLKKAKLPYRTDMLRMNKLRVASKHDAICPQASDLQSAVNSVQQFMEEATQIVFGFPFSKARLTSAIRSDDLRKMCEDAETAYEAGNHEECLILCRKAFYVAFEAPYDVASFKNVEVEQSLFAGAFNSAPHYAKSAHYILQHVREPFDYIVFDHDRLENDLARDNIDRVAFWNIWRLTPAVYLDAENWLVRVEPSKVGEDLQTNAAYVVDSIITILLQRQETRERHRWIRNSTQWIVHPRSPEVSIHSKADRSSPVVGKTRPEWTDLEIQYATPGFDGSLYWRFTLNKRLGEFVDGYIHNDDLTWEKAPVSDTGDQS